MDVSDIDHQGTDTMRSSANGNGLKDKARVAGKSAIDLTKATYDQIQDRALIYSHATDRAIRQNPYTAIGCAMGFGLLLGALLTTRRTKVVIKQKD
jgi:ElaB/YqjD/DUF883 family membrane-anchored ribosome-binding protein